MLLYQKKGFFLLQAPLLLGPVALQENVTTAPMLASFHLRVTAATEFLQHERLEEKQEVSSF